MSSELVDIARTLSRRIDIGKGMFFNADALALLAAIGVNEMIQQKASDYLREQSLRRTMRRGAIEGPGPRLAAIGGEQEGFGGGVAPAYDGTPPRSVVRGRAKPLRATHGPGVNEDLARAREILQARKKK